MKGKTETVRMLPLLLLGMSPALIAFQSAAGQAGAPMVTELVKGGAFAVMCFFLVWMYREDRQRSEDVTRAATAIMGELAELVRELKKAQLCIYERDEAAEIASEIAQIQKGRRQ
jgi:3-hydroxyisobutyrate dehydrogenase-like beta-hydroxyacid dehydrogenase